MVSILREGSRALLKLNGLRARVGDSTFMPAHLARGAVAVVVHQVVRRAGAHRAPLVRVLRGDVRQQLLRGVGEDRRRLGERAVRPRRRARGQERLQCRWLCLCVSSIPRLVNIHAI